MGKNTPIAGRFLLSVAGCAATAQTVVMAPGSQVPGKHGMNAAVGGILENLTYDFAPKSRSLNALTVTATGTC